MRIPSISKYAVAVLVLALMAGSSPARAQNGYDQQRYRAGDRTDAGARYDRNGRYDPNGQYDRSGQYIGRVAVTARYDRNGRYNANGQYDRSGRYIGNARMNSRSVIAFRSQPRMRMVPGTRVYVVDRNYVNPNYDVLQYGNRYYVYRNGDWYASRSWRGPFIMIDDAAIPVAFHQVAPAHWRSYPTGWTETRDDYTSYDDNPRTYVEPPRLSFRTEPRMRMIPGTQVYVINRAYTNTDYDMFRYGDTTYLYSDGNWFAASSWRGPFTEIDDREVPRALRGVPRDEWRSYPSGWLRVNVDR